MSRRVLPLVLAVVAATAAVHAPSLGGGFHYDDEAVVILNRENLRDPGTILRFFRDPDVFSGVPNNGMFRPVTYATEVWDAAVGAWPADGGPDPLPWHITNLLLHAACAAALLLLLRRVLRAWWGQAAGPFGERGPDAAALGALLGALWFGLQPVNAEVVNYVSSRSESLAALFFVIALGAHHAAWDPGRTAARRALLVAGSLAAAALSFGSKETGVLLPAAAGALELWGRRDAGSPGDRLLAAARRAAPLGAVLALYLVARRSAMGGALIPSRGHSAVMIAAPLLAAAGVAAFLLLARREGAREAAARGLKGAAVGLLVLAPLFLLVGGASGGGPLPGTTAGDPGPDPLMGGGRSVAAHLLTQARVVLASALLVLFPADLAPDHGVRVEAVLDGPTGAALALLLAALLGALRSILRGGRAVPLVTVWAGCALAPSVLVPLNVVMNEHRLYLPSTGLALGAGVLLLRGLAAARRAGRGGAAVGGLLLLFAAFGAVDASRAYAWRDALTLWGRAVETSPTSWRSHLHLGATEYRIGEALVNEADRIRGEDPLLAEFHRRQGYELLDSASGRYRTAHTLNPRAFEVRLNLGLLHLYRGRILNRDTHPDDPPRFPAEFEEAIRWLTLAEESSPGSFRALYNRATAMAEGGKLEEAIAEFERLSKDRSRTTMYAYPLADLYRRAGRPDDALAQLDRVERVDPGEAGIAALKKAEVLTGAGRFDEADRELLRAVELLGVDHYGPPLYKARLLVARGDESRYDMARVLWQAALDRGHVPGPKDRPLLEALR